MKLSEKIKKLLAGMLCTFLLVSCSSVKTEIEDMEELTQIVTLPVTEETEMTQTERPKPDECSEFNILPKDEFVRRLGRTTYDGDTLYTNYSLSGIEFEMEGTLCDVTITSDGERFKEEKKAYVAVTVNDGEKPLRFKLEDGTHTYRIFKSETPQNVKIRLEKLSEAAMGSMGIEKIKTISYFEPSPTEEKPLKIQFIGDSITCAYGIEGADAASEFKTAEENPLIGYANLTAERLSADRELLCWSGMGVVSNCTDRVGVKEDYVLMGDIYRREDVNYDNVTAREPVMFVRENRQPDIVVINMGTNDYFYTGDIPELVSKFGECYYDLLTEIRRQNPHADIICTLGVLGNDLMPEIERCAERFKREYDENIYTFEFERQDTVNDGMGSKYHPSAVTHKKMADSLTEFIIENKLNI